MFIKESQAVGEDAKAAVSMEIGRLGLDSLPSFDRMSVDRKLAEEVQRLTEDATLNFEADKTRAAMLKGV